VTDLASAIPELRRPFTVAAVKFKPQSVTKTGKTICVAYIDARLASERLNHVCPDAWSDSYRPVQGGQMWCDLTVYGITRSDVGEGQGKALVSDALKRAAVKFGVGVSLYAVPSMILPGEIKMLYPDSRETQALRDKYEGWLKLHGRKAFGDPLDHGDVPDSAGEPTGAAPEQAPSAGRQFVDNAIREASEAKAKGVKLAPIIGASGVDAKGGVKAAIERMTGEQILTFRADVAAAVLVAEAEAKLGAKETA
jgi:hypothetical protein